MNVEYFATLNKNLFAVLKKLKECVGFFFFNNLIATNEGVCEGLFLQTFVKRTVI